MASRWMKMITDSFESPLPISKFNRISIQVAHWLQFTPETNYAYTQYTVERVIN